MWSLLFQCLHEVRCSVAYFQWRVSKGPYQACKSLCTEENSRFIYDLALIANPILFPFCVLCFCNSCYVSQLDRLTWKSLDPKPTSTFELKILSCNPRIVIKLSTFGTGQTYCISRDFLLILVQNSSPQKEESFTLHWDGSNLQKSKPTIERWKCYWYSPRISQLL